MLSIINTRGSSYHGSLTRRVFCRCVFDPKSKRLIAKKIFADAQTSSGRTKQNPGLMCRGAINICASCGLWIFVLAATSKRRMMFVLYRIRAGKVTSVGREKMASKKRANKNKRTISVESGHTSISLSLTKDSDFLDSNHPPTTHMILTISQQYFYRVQRQILNGIVLMGKQCAIYTFKSIKLWSNKYTYGT